MSAPLKVGTRASLLARTQSTLVADRLAEARVPTFSGALIPASRGG